MDGRPAIWSLLLQLAAGELREAVREMRNAARHDRSRGYCEGGCGDLLPLPPPPKIFSMKFFFLVWSG